MRLIHSPRKVIQQYNNLRAFLWLIFEDSIYGRSYFTRQLLLIYQNFKKYNVVYRVRRLVFGQQYYTNRPIEIHEFFDLQNIHFSLVFRYHDSCEVMHYYVSKKFFIEPQLKTIIIRYPDIIYCSVPISPVLTCCVSNALTIDRHNNSHFGLTFYFCIMPKTFSFQKKL